MGPIMLDVQSTSLSAEDKELLEHPLVGGIILFTRNYESPQQVSELTKDIRKAANGDILIAVDHEGGRVQRFREKFSAIPAMGHILSLANNDLVLAQAIATKFGLLMALEVQAVGIDISFAPVLDVNGISDVIGDRAFHQKPETVVPLAESFINGMHLAGMKSTGKHFPGHGSVKEDSHFALPIDNRIAQDITAFDLLPFKKLISSNHIDALMPAHVIYPNIDSQAVGFSNYWLQTVLRKELAFEGVIFSDDISMEGAACVGDYVQRAEAAQHAGCDMILTCNNRAGCIEVIDHANISVVKQSSQRLHKLLKQTDHTWQSLAENSDWIEARKCLAQYS